MNIYPRVEGSQCFRLNVQAAQEDKASMIRHLLFANRHRVTSKKSLIFFQHLYEDLEFPTCVPVSLLKGYFGDYVDASIIPIGHGLKYSDK